MIRLLCKRAGKDKLEVTSDLELDKLIMRAYDRDVPLGVVSLLVRGRVVLRDHW